jgi:hypothetical protein
MGDLLGIYRFIFLLRSQHSSDSPAPRKCDNGLVVWDGLYSQLKRELQKDEISQRRLRSLNRKGLLLCAMPLIISMAENAAL